MLARSSWSESSARLSGSQRTTRVRKARASRYASNRWREAVGARDATGAAAGFMMETFLGGREVRPSPGRAALEEGGTSSARRRGRCIPRDKRVATVRGRSGRRDCFGEAVRRSPRSDGKGADSREVDPAVAEVTDRGVGCMGSRGTLLDGGVHDHFGAAAISGVYLNDAEFRDQRERTGVPSSTPTILRPGVEREPDRPDVYRRTLT